MTFKPEQIVTNKDWRRDHDGHEVVDRLDEFPLCGGTTVKRLHNWVCKTCHKSHLHKMETVEIGDQNDNSSS